MIWLSQSSTNRTRKPIDWPRALDPDLQLRDKSERPTPRNEKTFFINKRKTLKCSQKNEGKNINPTCSPKFKITQC